MARVARLTPRFMQRLRVSVPRGSDAAAAVGATIAALTEAAELPGVLDVRAAIPPTSSAYVRRVAGRNLWLWYRVDDEGVWLLNITAAPPVPLGE